MSSYSQNISTVLMCHAPVVIPEVAGDEADVIARTTNAMKKVADFVVSRNPQLVIILSPHAPRHPNAFGYYGGNTLKGNFSRFGFSKLKYEVPNAHDQLALLTRIAESQSINLKPLPNTGLDHGTLVPLHFLQQAGWRGETLVFGFPYETSHEQNKNFGRFLRDFCMETGKACVVVASGDMSHKLERGAPAGFHERAVEFDRWVVEHLKRRELKGAIHVDPTLRELAAEDIIDSFEIAAAMNSYHGDSTEFISYEGPFGVGYLVAILAADETEEFALLRFARNVIEQGLKGKRAERPSVSELLRSKKGVFVTLWDANRELRGCIGHIEPAFDDFLRDVEVCAMAAATQDTRFEPVTLSELASLKIELSILEPPEPISDASDLNPKVFGVVVKSGRRTGVLLPDIEGVDSVEMQLAIAKRKAFIHSDEPVELYRFRVKKISEGH